MICVSPELVIESRQTFWKFRFKSKTDKNNKIKKEVELTWVLPCGATDIITCRWVIVDACFEEMPVYEKKKTTELIEKKVIAKTMHAKKKLVEQHVQAGVVVSFLSYPVGS